MSIIELVYLVCMYNSANNDKCDFCFYLTSAVLSLEKKNSNESTAVVVHICSPAIYKAEPGGCFQPVSLRLAWVTS